MRRPEKTSRTSSKPPSLDREGRRERSKPGGANPGHEGHSRPSSDDVSETVAYYPEACPCHRIAPSRGPASGEVGVHERVELPEIGPVVVRHRRLAVRRPGCGTRVVAPPPAAGTPFGHRLRRSHGVMSAKADRRLHAVATYLKTHQASSYERPQAALFDPFGPAIGQGGVMKMLRRAQGRFEGGRERAVAALRRAGVVASDETGVRIEGSNAYHRVFRCEQAVVHHAAPSRAASVVREVMDGHTPEVWLSDRYSAQQGHAAAQQTCLAHLARDVAYAVEGSDAPVPFRLELWLASAFDPAECAASLAASTLAAKRRALERWLTDILAAPTPCDLARDLQGKLRRARDQLLTFADRPGEVAATDNACERDLRPSVIQRKVTNGYRAMWAAKGEADIRTLVVTARLTPGTGIFGIILQTVSA